MAVFDVSGLNRESYTVHKDPETGCSYVGIGIPDQTYESCRQAFYLKKQNEILKQNQSSSKTTPMPAPSVIVPQSGEPDPRMPIQFSGESLYLLGGVLIVGLLVGFLIKTLLNKGK